MLILYLTIYAPMKFQNFTVLVRYCNLESPKRKYHSYRSKFLKKLMY